MLFPPAPTNGASYSPSGTLAPDQQSLVVITVQQLQNQISQSVELAFQRVQQKKDGERRLTSKEAAAFLGCSVYHLQELHKRGLAYEKGRPNYYKLSDLQQMQ